MPKPSSAPSCTTDAHNDRVNYFLNEFFGTFMLVLGALCCLSLPWGKANPAAASIVVGFIVWGLVTSMGGPTGPGLNPARDLMPRLLHAILPIPNKGDSLLGRGLDSGRGPDRRRYRRRVPVQGAVRLSITLTIAGIRLVCW